MQCGALIPWKYRSVRLLESLPLTSTSKKINSGTRGKADPDLEFAKCLSWLTLVSDKVLASSAKESLQSNYFQGPLKDLDLILGKS